MSFADAEPRAQSSPEYLEYRRVLREVMAAIGSDQGLQLTESELGCLVDTLPRWPVFPDVADALGAMQTRGKLAIISNVDDDLFAGTARTLGVDFDAVITSQQARSYKPDPRSFNLAAERMATEKAEWLHVAEELVPRHRAGQPAGHRFGMGQPRRPGRRNPPDPTPFPTSRPRISLLWRG